MTLSNTAQIVIKTTAKSEGVPDARIKDALALMEGNTPSPTGQPVRLLTIKVTAKRFGCTERTVQRWIATGEIKFVRRGRLVRIPETELCS